MRQLKITQSITVRESQSIEKYLTEIGKVDLLSVEEEVELAKRIGSPNFKLLYDIYHMQIDEGDVIRTLTDNYQYIGHYHTAGVPGRHEINESQELYYPAIMDAIVKTGFKGYVAQEFMPTGKTNDEKIAALKDAVRRCDV